ncbi:hypothetical protein OsI_16906 [Oryza sativa Indica Group]|uniref:Uncharacterized protein n=2 Tax=Oryza sativa TaxID=4530 RepID=B9FGH2_ORYSJ|nr:hypothetical protein OsI_16906 [Oryza sativa Indica Group]EEE61456.1 hypothetical protein OsJ_15703 [Oryza sativa Japonica Group]
MISNSRGFRYSVMFHSIYQLTTEDQINFLQGSDSILLLPPWNAGRICSAMRREFNLPCLNFPGKILLNTWFNFCCIVNAPCHLRKTTAGSSRSRTTYGEALGGQALPDQVLEPLQRIEGKGSPCEKGRSMTLPCVVICDLVSHGQ